MHEKNSTVVDGMLYPACDSVGEGHVFDGSEITRLREDSRKISCAVSDAQRTV